MSLLRADAWAEIEKAATMRRVSRQDAFRRARFGADSKQIPAGMTRLERPRDRATWIKSLQRQQLREQEGFAPGDAASRAMDHPAVREVVTQ